MPSLGAAFQPDPPGAIVKEQVDEAMQSVLIWQPGTVSTKSGTFNLTKAPIIGNVPQVRRKLTSRNSTSGPRFDPMLASTSSTPDRGSGLVSTIIRPTQNWLREKPSRAKLGPPASNVHISGEWRRARLHFRESSILLVLTAENALLHSIACSDLCTNHIRKVDSSLFGKMQVLGIFSRPSTLTPLSPRQKSTSSTTDEPIYLAFYSRSALHKWLHLLRICAQPELYGSPATLPKGGTHRFYRQLDMTINNVKLFNNHSISASSTSDSAALPDSYLPPGSSAAAHTNYPRPTSSVPQMAGQDLDGSGREDTILQCYCIVRSGLYAIARTKVFSTTPSQIWLEKFSIGDLAPWTTLSVELIQVQRSGKTQLIGIVDLPIHTMRRGEDIDGWFPIWSSARSTSGPVSIGSAADPAVAYSRELIGELKLIIHVRDEVIMPRKRYDQIQHTLNSEKFVPLVTVLTKVVDEQALLSNLVDVFASSGTIVPRMADLTKAEMRALGDDAELELLFRGNSLLSRSLDKYQRTYCSEWLYDSIGGAIGNICEKNVVIETPMAHDDGNAAGSASTVGNGQGGASNITGEGETRFLNQVETIEFLNTHTRLLWKSIYFARDKCPRDLQSILATIRSEVDAKFAGREGTVDAGKQAVGAFAFLRLICPAIAAPHLYGILPSAPEPALAKVLTTLAKIILVLANRRFDKDTWLAPMTDFFKTQADLYDDYISTISTVPSEGQPTTYVPFGDEDDTAFSQAIQDKISRLYPIHRESIPSINCAMDEPLALATLTSYIARNVPAELLQDGSNIVTTVGDSNMQLDLDTLGEQGDLLRRFARLACYVEEHAGYFVDKAGFDATPLELVERTFKNLNLTGSLATVSVGKSATPPVPVSVVSPVRSVRNHNA
ncbi:hypothetical protein OC846_005871 [Tilletia horrida]|uniref:Ras-GAP domain-containing protein n=1 Tax=Tilletia horrida TaxID=155126 RepID=A0AAN6GMQ8_9BASI|nr:hypothetical protein OC846_005871 [Tilletia horrida]KAK0544940.1 hypothetical protein OC845_005356 [Tilletia horrida]